MTPRGPLSPFRNRSIGRADLHAFPLASFQTPEVERFVGPIERIRAEVLGGASHVLTVVEAGGQPLGFFVTHPDPHDAACWWLGYLAVTPAACGRGVGRAMLASVIRRLAGIVGCRRIRLLVDPGNLTARRLYAGHGFVADGARGVTGEIVLTHTIDHGRRTGRSTMRRLSLRRRTAAERSPARVCAVWGTVLPGRSPP